MVLGWLIRIVWWLLSPVFNWIVRNLVKRPRFWEDEEWKKFTEKEKFWVWYKHHWYIRGSGSAEMDQFTTPLKEMILYGSVILSNYVLALMYLDIKLDYFALLTTVAFGCFVAWSINFVLQWKIGDWKDDKDLIALENDIGDRRRNEYRYIRKLAMKEPFRKGL